jgi:hypothetical protein
VARQHHLGALADPATGGCGSRIELVARFLGCTLAYIYEVVECGPYRLVMRTAQGPFPMETSCTRQLEGVERTDDAAQPG